MTATETLAEQTHAHCNHHLHEHSEQAPAITERWKWLTVLGNAAIGTAELLTGNTSALSVAADGLHNVGDTGTYYMQAETVLNRSMPEEKRTRWRKAAHWIIAASSLGVSVKAGADLALDHESAVNPFAVYTAGASLLLNGWLLGRLRKGIRQTEYVSNGDRDLLKHFWAVDMPSAALAVLGVMTHGVSTAAEQALAVASGLVGAYAFRPTEANLTHGHCLDGHSHHDHGGHARKGWLKRMRYKPLHSVTTPIEQLPIHPWTCHPSNYKRDLLLQIQQNGERPRLKASVRAIGQLLLWSVCSRQKSDQVHQPPAAVIGSRPSMLQIDALAETAQPYDEWEGVKRNILEGWRVTHAQAERDIADMRARYDAATTAFYPTD
jgi:hypothetical protein